MNRLKTDTSAQELVHDLEKQVPELMKATAVPGLSLALIRGGELFWSRAWGVRSRASQEPVTPDTLFEAASLSKPVFAYGCLELCQAGILDLDAPLAGYLPEPYLPDDPRFGLITMRHVLSHTTGLPNWRPQGGALSMHLSPGERFSYSGEGYLYLQAVVEQVTGQPPAEHLRENLLEPLGMVNSRFVWTGQQDLPVAVGHDRGGQPKDKGLWPTMNAAASLHTTPTDLARFMGAIVRPPAENGAHLSPEVMEEMLRPQVQVNDSAPWHRDWPRPEIRLNDRVAWGLGWGLQCTALGDSIWHWGDNGCYHAFVEGFLEPGHGLIVMNNGQNGYPAIKAVLQNMVGGEHPGLDWLESTYAG